MDPLVEKQLEDTNKELQGLLAMRKRILEYTGGLPTGVDVELLERVDEVIIKIISGKAP